MKGKIFFGFLIVLVLSVYVTPSSAQDISGWWSGKGTYQQGDCVTGDWTLLQARGKKMSYLYISPLDTQLAYFLIWDDLSSDYLVEIYYVYTRFNIVALYMPTFYDSTNAPATSTIILRAVGSASTITSMSGYYALYDFESEGSPDLFVRTGSIIFNHVLVDKVPQLAKEKIPFP